MNGNVLIEMNALAFARPGLDASAEQVAAWYEAKSRLHEHLAQSGGPKAAAQEMAYAAAAHQHALDLLASTNNLNGAAA